ncbi:hypothetical protein ACHAPU_001222, partial [Fusarium lateritium]
MGIKNCPLCEIQGDVDSPGLIDHVLEHIHDFSLRSLPWPISSDVDLGGEVGSFNSECEAAVIVAGWLKGYEHETADIEPTLKLSRYDYRRLAVIAEDIKSGQQDKFGLDICFADEHGDESAEAETDVSQLTHETPVSLKEVSQLEEADGDHSEEYRNEPNKQETTGRRSSTLLGKLTSRIFSRNRSKDLATQNGPKVADNLSRFPELSQQAYDVLSKLYQRRIDSFTRRKSLFHKFIEDVQGEEISVRDGAVLDLASFLQVMVESHLYPLKPLPPKDLTKTISEYYINTSRQTFLSRLSSNPQSSLDSIRKALQTGYRSIDIEVRDGVADTMDDFEIEEENPQIKPVVAYGGPLSESSSFLDVCAVIRSSGFLNNSMPIIVNFMVLASPGQQQTMVGIMKEEWRGFLVDEPLDDCDPEFRLPRLEDLQNRILVRVSGPVDSGIAQDTSLDDNDQDSFLIPSLSSLGVYLQGKPFEGFHSPQAKTPSHFFSWQEDSFIRLVSDSPTAAVIHNQEHICRVDPEPAMFHPRNLDPSRFWNYGVQMTAISHLHVDEGFMLNRGMFEDESG